MEEVKNSLNRNLLFGIIIPIFFLVTLFSYFQIDSYYSKKYWEDMKLKPVSQIKSPYKLLYAITKSNLENNILNFPYNTDSETIPSTDNYYQNMNIYNPLSAEIHVYEDCVLENGIFVKKINYIQEVGSLDSIEQPKKVLHFLLNDVYYFDFSDIRAHPLECNSRYNFSQLNPYDTNIYSLKSPDNLIRFYEDISVNSSNNPPSFPYLKDLYLEKQPNSLSGYSRIEILINGKYYDTDQIKFDPKSNIDFFVNNNTDKSIQFFGWVR